MHISADRIFYPEQPSEDSERAQLAHMLESALTGTSISFLAPSKPCCRNNEQRTISRTLWGSGSSPIPCLSRLQDLLIFSQQNTTQLMPCSSSLLPPDSALFIFCHSSSLQQTIIRPSVASSLPSSPEAAFPLPVSPPYRA